ncbi:hypothetical protein EXIGLDRAFT_726266 [Exidia glandulosa HHB12029]|uniref:Uncharacterized protein n=1 Tax=Exidia glandulosa HHB12029 TaxID=1314781 RepID=A0A165DU72_EXIGL|nr:hypothetical protein EXIGLDRAFT_726266 [Exidia glandulosa HHB12029]
MQLEDEEDHVVVASMEGMPTQAELRAMSAEKMQDVLRAINKRLPEAMRVEVEEPAEESKLRALLEDVLGYSSSTLAPRRPSLSICPSTPKSPLTKDCTNTPSHLAAPASSSPLPLKSPSFVLRPESAPTSPCCDQSSPTRNAAQRALHGITALLAPPAGIPAELLNGHAEHLRARESPMRDPFVMPMSDDHVEMMTVTPMQTKKRTLDPVEEEVHAEEAEEKKEENAKTLVRVKRARYSEGTAATATPVTSPTRLTRSQSARLAADKVRVTRSMASGIAAASSPRPSVSTPAVGRRGRSRRDSVSVTPAASVSAVSSPPSEGGLSSIPFPSFTDSLPVVPDNTLDAITVEAPSTVDIGAQVAARLSEVTPWNAGPHYSDEEDEECDWSMVAEAGTVKSDLSVEDRAALLEGVEVDELDVTVREPFSLAPTPAPEADEENEMGGTSSMCPQSAVKRTFGDEEDEDLESSPATIRKTKADRTSYTLRSDDESTSEEEADLMSDFLLRELHSKMASEASSECPQSAVKRHAYDEESDDGDASDGTVKLDTSRTLHSDELDETSSEDDDDDAGVITMRSTSQRTLRRTREEDEDELYSTPSSGARVRFPVSAVSSTSARDEEEDYLEAAWGGTRALKGASIWWQDSDDLEFSESSASADSPSPLRRFSSPLKHGVVEDPVGFRPTAPVLGESSTSTSTWMFVTQSPPRAAGAGRRVVDVSPIRIRDFASPARVVQSPGMVATAAVRSRALRELFPDRASSPARAKTSSVVSTPSSNESDWVVPGSATPKGKGKAKAK